VPHGDSVLRSGPFIQRPAEPASLAVGER
jgi:hypothetical protein